MDKPRIGRKCLVLCLATLTCAAGFTYVAVQQTLRLSADEPQSWMAADAAVRLDAGADPASMIAAADRVDLARDPAPYLIIFNADGRPIASTALLDGQTPVPPAGVFLAAKASGADHVTWQPRTGIREAATVVPYGQGFVLAGRSLKPAEDAIDVIGRLLICAWLAAAAAVLALGWLLGRRTAAPEKG